MTPDHAFTTSTFAVDAPFTIAIVYKTRYIKFCSDETVNRCPLFGLETETVKNKVRLKIFPFISTDDRRLFILPYLHKKTPKRVLTKKSTETFVGADTQRTSYKT